MEHTKVTTTLLMLVAVVLCSGPVGRADPIGTAFTYQGRLIDANQVADGLYDFQFKLFEAATDGNQLGADVNTPDVDVIDGYFTVGLDFGSSVFDGDARWLEIGVRPGDFTDPNVYTVLEPRQEMTPTPYALYAQSSGGLNTSGDLALISETGNVEVGSSENPAILHIFGPWNMYDANGAKGTKGVYPTEYEGAGYSETDGGKLFTTSKSLTLEAGDGNVAIGTVDNPANLHNFAEVRIYPKNAGSKGTKGVFPTDFEGASYGTPSEIEWDFGDDDKNANTFVDYTSNGSGADIAFCPDGLNVLIGAPSKAVNLLVTGSVDVGDVNNSANLKVTGNVGIGTTNPSSPLTIKTVAGSDIELVSTGSNADIVTNAAFRVGTLTGQPFSIITNNLYQMTVDSAGNVGIGTASPTEKLDVVGTARIRDINVTGDPNVYAVVCDSTGKLFKSVSSRRYKTDVRNLDADTDAVLKLRPVRFEWQTTGQEDIGLIAEEVEKVSKDLVIYDGQGRPDGVKYDKVALYLLSAVKNQQEGKDAVIESLQKENEEIKARLAAMESLVTKLSVQQEGGIK